MSELIRYVRRGMRKAIIVGTPDFRFNNQYTDMENIGYDFQISIERAIKDEPRASRARKEFIRKRKTIKA